MDSRIPFIKEVAQTIADNYAKGEESFIFGISGKWGEGKTYFLYELKEALKKIDINFEIFDVNAWKFSSDNISFLRNFLKNFYSKDAHQESDDFKQFEFDTAKSDIDWKKLAPLIVWIVLFAVLYLNEVVRRFVENIPQDLKIIGSIIIIPILLAIIGKVVVIQKSDHAVSTLDKFDEFLEKIITRFSSQNKKIIVFVDDLDRVTPEIARSVLDNLRTFFDKKDIAFVVTGDHTVLERYLGKSLLPDGSIPAQLEEGRRFLKKIFNVYWRLPLPIEKEVELFVEDEFAKRASTLDKIFTQEDSRKKFKSYLGKYFEKNFRQIIRFLDTTLFNFKIIKQKIDGDDKTQKQYFGEVWQNPLLVIRILMIQELCAPLFDRILDDPQILSDLEYAVSKKDTEKINAIINQYKKDLSDPQEDFIKKFIYEEPRFFEGTILRVSDLRPFLFLAADASFGDQRGPSQDDFIKTVASGDPAQVKVSLASTGETKARGGAKELVKQLNSSITEPAKSDYTKTLVSALASLPKEHAMHKIFAEELKPIDLTTSSSIDYVKKLELFNAFWLWLDIVENEKLTKPYVEKFQFSSTQDIDSIKLVNKQGVFTSTMLVEWLKKYYPNNPADAVNRMSNTLPELNRKEVEKNMIGMENQIVTELINDSNTDLKEKRFNIIKGFMPKGREILKESILNQVNSLNANITQWAIGKLGDIWKKEDLENTLFNKLDNAKDFNEIITTLRFINENKIGESSEIWSKVVPKHVDLLVDNFSQIVSEQFQAIPPTDQIADQIMGTLIEKIKKLSEAEQIQWLDYLKKSRWIWANLKKGPMKRKFSVIDNTENEMLKQTFDSVKLSWNQD